MKKGFASAGMIYTLLVLFLIVTVTMITTIQNKKTMLDKLKEETADTLYCNQNIINELSKKIETLNEEIKQYDEDIKKIKQTGTVTENDILTGKTVYSQGKVVTGVMNNINGQVSAKDAKTFDDVKKVGLQINTKGYYDNANIVYISTKDLLKKIGLTSDVIAEGEEIFGVIGTYKKSYAATYTIVSRNPYECCSTSNCRTECWCTNGWGCDMSAGYCQGYCIGGAQTCGETCDRSCSTCYSDVWGYTCPNGGTLNNSDKQCYY